MKESPHVFVAGRVSGGVVSFSDRRAGQGLMCVAEVRVTMIQGFSTPGCAIDMLIKFRESSFQISLVKIPSNNECSLLINCFQFEES